MPINTLSTGPAAGPAPSGPPAARAGAPPGFLAALDSAAQTWTASAEGHSDNSGSRTDAATGRTKATPGPGAKQTSGDAAAAPDTDVTDAAPQSTTHVVTQTRDGDAEGGDGHENTSATADVAVPRTDAPVAPDTALLAMLGMLPQAAAPAAPATPVSVPATIVPSATPPMVGATPAELVANAQLPAAPTAALTPGTDGAATAAAPTAAQTDTNAQALAGQSGAGVAELLAAVTPQGTPTELPASALEKLIDRGTAAQADAASAQPAAVAPTGAPTPAVAPATTPATDGLAAPAPDAAATQAAAKAAAAAAAGTTAPADPTTPQATPADAAAAALAAANATLAPDASTQPGPAPQQLSPLAQAIQAAAAQGQPGSSGSGAQGRPGGRHSDQDASAVDKTAVAKTPTDAGAPLAGAQAAAGMASTAAAPVSPTAVVTPANPAAQAAAIEALVNLSRKDGASQARIKLKPESLGGIEVTLTFGANGVTAKLIADRPEAAAALNQAGQDLKNSLQDKGIDLASLETGFAGSMGQQGDGRSAQHANGSSNTGSGSHRSGNGGDDTTLHIALDDQPAAQQPLAAGRTIDLRA